MNKIELNTQKYFSTAQIDFIDKDDRRLPFTYMFSRQDLESGIAAKILRKDLNIKFYKIIDNDPIFKLRDYISGKEYKAACYINGIMLSIDDIKLIDES